jgi:predicted amino acid racemase
MFLEATRQRNPRLLQAALTFHQAGLIPPNTYVLDYDAVQTNARLLNEAASAANLSLFFITKQIGHNPAILQAIQHGGLLKGTAVDVVEAYALASNGVTLGNVGHLVQIPRHDLRPVLTLNPEFFTVFSYHNAQQVYAWALPLKRDTQIMLRVCRPGDFFYPGQVGGVELDQVVEVARAINTLPHLRVMGVTSYPCLEYDESQHELRPLPNLETVLKARDVLEKALGYSLRCVDTPGATSVSAVKLLSHYGVTHAEPGHALTGTTPLHAGGDQPETPAMVYVSEVSHIQGDTAYIFGGGFYRRSRVKAALVGRQLEDLNETPVPCSHPAPDTIDYYGQLDAVPGRVRVGDSVIMAFRAQIFVAHSHVAAIRHVDNQPQLMGLWDARGRPAVYGVAAERYGAN